MHQNIHLICIKVFLVKYDTKNIGGRCPAFVISSGFFFTALDLYSSRMVKLIFYVAVALGGGDTRLSK